MMAGSHKIDTAKTETEGFYLLTSDPAEYDQWELGWDDGVKTCHSRGSW